jgi:hypothetical protein
MRQKTMRQKLRQQVLEMAEIRSSSDFKERGLRNLPFSYILCERKHPCKDRY